MDFLNSLDTKYKGTFYAEKPELKVWEHIASKKKNLVIHISSPAAQFSGDSAFTYFNYADKTDEIAINEAIYNSPFIRQVMADVERIATEEIAQVTTPQPLQTATPEIVTEITGADIEATLLDWNGNEDSKARVLSYTQDHSRERGTAEWLKHEYGGNVPFGNYKLSEKRYDNQGFLIHDHFFAKALDKVRPGGVVAFVSSKGTMDKKNPEVRRYLAQRAELLEAIRLPNNAFSKNAGTEVTSDILFLQKRDRPIDVDRDWIHLGFDENDITLNSYFADHPEMILGNMEMVSGQFGEESACVPIEGVRTATGGYPKHRGRNHGI